MAELLMATYSVCFLQ